MNAMSNNFPALNLPPCELRVKKEGEQHFIWDSLRGIWLVLTPEEWVRQNFIRFMESGLRAAGKNISQEFPVNIAGKQRADIVLYGSNGRPCMLVECKAPSVKLDKSVLAQAVRYNSVVKAPYIVLTNGEKHHCFSVEEQGIMQLPDFPDLSPFFRIK